MTDFLALVGIVCSRICLFQERGFRRLLTALS
jgi:hypothetical protein